ncbi:unnamed protein product [Prunus armeniaca]|uniref:Uncharacterized protein n=1 Tax=Prunus armeniaca TaxID=36596 RepID=A0A6J5TGH3_PRUAR|nr:unnamed protein product [Prunus armeniaca]
MPKLGVGKTILKRPTLTKGQKDSAEEHNKTTLPEPRRRSGQTKSANHDPQEVATSQFDNGGR